MSIRFMHKSYDLLGSSLWSDLIIHNYPDTDITS